MKEVNTKSILIFVPTSTFFFILHPVAHLYIAELDLNVAILYFIKYRLYFFKLVAFFKRNFVEKNAQI